MNTITPLDNYHKNLGELIRNNQFTINSLNEYLNDNYDINYRNIWTDDSLLSYATKHNNFDVVKLLLNYNNNQDNLFKSLSYCCRWNKSNLIEILIPYFHNINYRDNEGNTLLMIASYHGNINTVNLLLSKKAHINICNHKNETALSLAFNNKKYTVNANLQLVKLLTKKLLINKNISLLIHHFNKNYYE